MIQSYHKTEQWSILSNVQCNRHLKNIYNLGIRAVDSKSHKNICNKEEERQILELDFGDTPKVISNTRFYENSDL